MAVLSQFDRAQFLSDQALRRPGAVAFPAHDATSLPAVIRLHREI
jgi:hypothetical protein